MGKEQIYVTNKEIKNFGEKYWEIEINNGK